MNHKWKYDRLADLDSRLCSNCEALEIYASPDDGWVMSAYSPHNTSKLYRKISDRPQHKSCSELIMNKVME